MNSTSPVASILQEELLKMWDVHDAAPAKKSKKTKQSSRKAKGKKEAKQCCKQGFEEPSVQGSIDTQEPQQTKQPVQQQEKEEQQQQASLDQREAEVQQERDSQPQLIGQQQQQVGTAGSRGKDQQLEAKDQHLAPAQQRRSLDKQCQGVAGTSTCTGAAAKEPGSHGGQHQEEEHSGSKDGHLSSGCGTIGAVTAAAQGLESVRCRGQGSSSTAPSSQQQCTYAAAAGSAHHPPVHVPDVQPTGGTSPLASSSNSRVSGKCSPGGSAAGDTTYAAAASGRQLAAARDSRQASRADGVMAAGQWQGEQHSSSGAQCLESMGVWEHGGRSESPVLMGSWSSIPSGGTGVGGSSSSESGSPSSQHQLGRDWEVIGSWQLEGGQSCHTLRDSSDDSSSSVSMGGWELLSTSDVRYNAGAVITAEQPYHQQASTGVAWPGGKGSEGAATQGALPAANPQQQQHRSNGSNGSSSTAGVPSWRAYTDMPLSADVVEQLHAAAAARCMQPAQPCTGPLSSPTGSISMPQQQHCPDVRWADQAMFFAGSEQPRCSPSGQFQASSYAGKSAGGWPPAIAAEQQQQLWTLWGTHSSKNTSSCSVGPCGSTSSSRHLQVPRNAEKAMEEESSSQQFSLFSHFPTSMGNSNSSTGSTNVIGPHHMQQHQLDSSSEEWQMGSFHHALATAVAAGASDQDRMQQQINGCWLRPGQLHGMHLPGQHQFQKHVLQEKAMEATLQLQQQPSRWPGLWGGWGLFAY